MNIHQVPTNFLQCAKRDGVAIYPTEGAPFAADLATQDQLAALFGQAKLFKRGGNSGLRSGIERKHALH
mgnify:CR=1 FL=1